MNSLYTSFFFFFPVSFSRSRWKHEHSVSWYSGKYERIIILCIHEITEEKKHPTSFSPCIWTCLPHGFILLLPVTPMRYGQTIRHLIILLSISLCTAYVIWTFLHVFICCISYIICKMSVYVFWVPCSGWEFTLGISVCSMSLLRISEERPVAWITRVMIL